MGSPRRAFAKPIRGLEILGKAWPGRLAPLVEIERSHGVRGDPFKLDQIVDWGGACASQMLKTPLFARAVSELLRIDGFFPTRPEQVNFTLAFEIGDGKWQLSALGVHATPPQHATAALETSDAKLPATTGSIAVTTQPKR